MAGEHPAMPELRALIGQLTDPIVSVIDEGAIKFFADSILDPNPLYCDPEYAKETPYGGIVAPPTFVGGASTLRNVKVGDDRVVAPIKLPASLAGRGVNGGDEFEFFVPIRPGDTIVSRSRLTKATEKRGRSGTMIFLQIETTYTNQKGELAVVRRGTSILRLPAEEGEHSNG